jgi:hypothetical protein
MSTQPLTDKGNLLLGIGSRESHAEVSLVDFQTAEVVFESSKDSNESQFSQNLGEQIQ